MAEIMLPRADGTRVQHRLGPPAALPRQTAAPRLRTAYAAAHVVCDPLADPGPGAHLDWEATLAYRRHLWGCGLGVAEAMDTAQRGMGLDWGTARELIRRSVREASLCGGTIACGAGTDQLPPGPADLQAVEAAYAEQCAHIEACGGRVILMASRALCAAARGPQDYHRVYSRILGQLRQPAILHWLGPAFDPALAGYWGAADPEAAMDQALEIIRDCRRAIDGIKLSLLDADAEVRMRRRLPPGVRMYTGDDFNYPELIAGDDQGFSHALLGIFDPIAPVAASALAALDRADRDAYDATFAPTVPLSRHMFCAPTYNYKTGVVFLAYLNGHQRHFRMVGGAEGARSVVHLAELFVLADHAGLLSDPERAAARLHPILALAGVAEG